MCSSDLARALRACGAPILAIDLPTGLNSDTGQRLGDDAVVATATLSLLGLAPGLFTAQGRDLAGEVWHDTLGQTSDGPCNTWLLGSAEAAATSARRSHDSHKGRFGDLWVLGGAPGMTGAATLAASAAQIGRAHV